MMTVKGIQRVNYTRKDGTQVNGTNLVVIFEDKRWVNGVGFDIIYCPKDTARDVKIDDVIKPIYNKYGKVEEVAIAG